MITYRSIMFIFTILGFVPVMHVFGKETTTKASTEVSKEVKNSTQEAPKKKRGYSAHKLTYDVNMEFFDNAISLAPGYIGDIQEIIDAAEFVLKQGQQKKTNLSSSEGSETSEATVKEQLKQLIKTFEKFASYIQKFSSCILPALEESLKPEKIKNNGLILVDGKSYLMEYAASTENTQRFFEARIKTKEALMQLSGEMYIFLSDFLKSMPRAGFAYKEDLKRKERRKAEAEAEKKHTPGEKDELTSV